MAPGATQRPWALIRADRSPDLFEPDLFEPDLFEPDLFEPDLFEPDLFEPDLFEPCLFESEQDKLEAETWARSEDEGVFPG